MIAPRSKSHRVFVALVVVATVITALRDVHASPTGDTLIAIKSLENFDMTPLSALQTVLVSSAPKKELEEKLAPFKPLVGSWDVHIIYYDENGEQRVTDGEWHFGWGLDGRALLDVWIAPKRELRDQPMSVSGEWGLTVRFYDPSIDAIRSVWHGPKHHVLMPFVGRFVNDEIILEGSFDMGVMTRWIFSKIESDSFHWRNVESRDNWKTLKLTQEMFATRRRD